MPSAKILSEKQAYVADLKAKFDNAVSGCVVAYGGINVENDTKLRKELREAGVEYMVVKNTMLRLAVKGTSVEGLTKNFTGDTAVAFAHAEDPMAAARILCKYQDGDKSKKFVVKGGFLEGKVLSAAETNAIAKLPAAKACCPCLQAPSPAPCLVWPLLCRLLSTSRRSPLLDCSVTLNTKRNSSHTKITDIGGLLPWLLRRLLPSSSPLRACPSWS